MRQHTSKTHRQARRLGTQDACARKTPGHAVLLGTKGALRTPPQHASVRRAPLTARRRSQQDAAHSKTPPHASCHACKTPLQARRLCRTRRLCSRDASARKATLHVKRVCTPDASASNTDLWTQKNAAAGKNAAASKNDAASRTPLPASRLGQTPLPARRLCQRNASAGKTPLPA